MFLKFLNYKRAIAFLFIFVFLGTLTLGDFKKSENTTAFAGVCTGIDVGVEPRYLTVAGENLYSFNQSNISVINLASGSVVDTIDFLGANQTRDSILIGTDLYFSSNTDQYLDILDTTTGQITTDAIDKISNSDGNFGPIIGNNLYFWAGTRVFVVDITTNLTVDEINIGGSPTPAFALIGTDLYLSSNGLVVIDTLTNTITETIGAGDIYARYIIFNEGFIYAGSINQSEMYVIDVATNTLVETIETSTTSGHSPLSMTLVGDDIYYRDLFNDNSVKVFDTNTNTVSDVIDLPYIVTGGLESLILSGNNLYTLSSDEINNEDYLTIIDITTNTLVDNVQVGIALDHTITYGDKVYISDFAEDKIFVFDTTVGAIIDACGPVLISSEIDGYTLTLTYDEDLDEDSIPSIDSFAIEIDSVLVAVEEVSVVGDTVTLTMISPAYYGDVVTMNYVVPLSDEIQDLFENEALPITDRLVVNNTTTCSIINVGTVPFSATLVGNNLYVNNLDSGDISVIDTLNYDVVDTIDVGVGPYYSAVAGTDLYVFVYGTETVIVDTLTNTVTGSLPAGSESYLWGTLVGTDLYINNVDTGEVEVLNTLDNTILETITVGDGPYSSTLVGEDLYVFNSWGDTVSVIDTTTNTVTETVTVGLSPYSGTLVGTDLYVNDYGDGTVSVLDTSTNTVSEAIALSSGPQFSVLVGTNLYVSNPDENAISVIDTATNTVTDTHTMDHDGDGAPLFLNLINGNIYVSNGVSVVYIIDPDTNALYDCPATFNLNYTAGANGSVDGDTSQTLTAGEDGTPVTAVPNSGYEFAGWSDNSNDNPRTDLNVSANISVTASFRLATSEETVRSGGISGTTVHGRFRNLLNMGKFQEAYSLIDQFPHMFISEKTNDYNFCDNALFVDFMKMKDVDGKYSAYNGGVVKEVSKLQTFINKLLISQYIQAAGPIDGIFGPLTKIGVERLQNLLNGSMKLQNDLVIDGIVGPYTRSAINNFCLPDYFQG